MEKGFKVSQSILSLSMKRSENRGFAIANLGSNLADIFFLLLGRHETQSQYTRDRPAIGNLRGLGLSRLSLEVLGVAKERSNAGVLLDGLI